MLITLGRNEPDGKYAVVVKEEKGDVYIVVYKQKNGMTVFNEKNEVARILLTDCKMSCLTEYYNRLKNVTESPDK
jgi:hypothetical protein